MAKTVDRVELKSGMVLELRCGSFVQVFIDSCSTLGDVFSGPDVWGPLDDFDQDGFHFRRARYDIMAIYKPSSCHEMRKPISEMRKIAIRESHPDTQKFREMTVAEIEAKLGHPVKVIKEEE